MMLMKANIEPLATDIPLAVQIVLVAPAFDDLIIFDANFQSAKIDSQNTRRFFPLGHIRLLMGTYSCGYFKDTSNRLTGLIKVIHPCCIPAGIK